ncbi:MAG TPA: tetratricopeptide repeat protein [Polyangiaceae bacterium]
MSELRPLHEEAESEAERAVLGAGLAYRASQKTRAATLNALGVSRGTSRRRRPWLFTLAAAASLVAVVSGGAAAYRYQTVWRIERVAAPPLVLPPPPTVARAGKAPKPVDPEPSLPEPTPAVEETVAPPSSVPARARAKPATPSRAPLAGELAVLDAAAAAVAAGNHQRGLVLLDAYAKDYPKGRLALEAEVLRIDALAGLGDRDQAASAAERFVKKHPDSVLAARARRHLRD